MIKIEDEMLNLSFRDGPQWETYYLTTEGEDEIDLMHNAVVTQVAEGAGLELDLDHCDPNIQKAVAIKCKVAVIAHQIQGIIDVYGD